MRKITISTVLAAVVALTMVGAVPAGAATKFSNCDAMHRVHRFGVAKSAAAARKQVNSGHHKPFVSLALYNANSASDADKDGTACEVTN